MSAAHAIMASQINNYIGKHMRTITTLLNIRDEISEQYGKTRLKDWSAKLSLAQEINKMSRAIEAYLGVDIDRTHDVPETLEDLKHWFDRIGLGWYFNVEVKEHGIPVTLIEETIAA